MRRRLNNGRCFDDKVILAAEREQIAAWGVQGFARLKEQGGYTIPVSSMALVREMATLNNSVYYFLADCPRLMLGREAHKGKSETHTTGDRLHHEYLCFCISMGLATHASQRMFHTMMKDLEKRFGFNQQVKMTYRGGSIIDYEWITLVSVKAAA